MDAKDGRPASERDDVRGDRPGHALGRAAAGDPAQEALARGADDDRPAELDDLVQAGEQLEVVVDGLAEADAGIEPDSLARDAVRDRMLEALGEKRADVGDDVAVARIALHRARLAEHVHEADVAAALGDERRHPGVAAQRGHVVDERGAGVERSGRHRRLRGVDRQARARAREALEDGHHAAQLLGLADRIGAGAGRLAADVEDRGALLDERPAVCDRGRRVEPSAAVGERVGGDVYDAHHDRLGNWGGHRPHVSAWQASGQRVRAAYALRPISGSTPNVSA